LHFNCIDTSENSPVQVVGAMRDAMWKGDLGTKITIDTLNRAGTFGIGPFSNMKGEILLWDGLAYVATIVDKKPKVEVSKEEVGAPFFVYQKKVDWKVFKPEKGIRDGQSLEKELSGYYEKINRPFSFKVTGLAIEAKIHIQNLPDGQVVSSPQEAHIGQVKLNLKDREVELLGFYSEEHQAIFTHHDSFVHMHLITKDKELMGHVDEIWFEVDVRILVSK
jgi:acetolactate decarboxylase